MIRVRGEDGKPVVPRTRIHELKPGTSYQIAVKSSGPGGSSAWLTDKFVTKDRPHVEPTPPPPISPPKTVRFETVTPDRVTLVIEDDQTNVDFYEVTLGSQRRTKIVETGTPYTITNLQPATAYDVTVAAVKGRLRSAPYITDITTPQVRVPFLPFF